VGSAYGTLVQYVRVAEHTAGEPVNELLRLKRNHLNGSGLDIAVVRRIQKQKVYS